MLCVPGSVADRIGKAISPFGYSVQNVSTHAVISGHTLHIAVTRESWDQPAEIAARAAVIAEFPFLVSEDGVHLAIT